MPLIKRAYQGDHDRQRMTDLVLSQPHENIHYVDLPYRFSSWAFDDNANLCLWEDERGELMAWAILQTPFWAIDYVYHAAAPATIHAEILAWADAQARRQLKTMYGHPMWFVNVFDWQHQRQRELEDHGFASQAEQGDDSWSKVLLQHSGESDLLTVPLPDGWTIRPLRGVEEVEAYAALHRAVFESKNMTSAWRARTLQHPDYRPELDLVAIDPAGAIAAFCVGWLAASGPDGRPAGQIEPLGVRADARGQGIGRAILAEGVRRLYQHGATQVLVETHSYRNSAFGLYTSAGFEVVHTILVYRKDYPSADS
jgi:ribosomal protein S18 acetylase RimI-like enzyme